MRQIIIDMETTGLSPENGDRAIEIAAVELLNGKMTGHCFQTYLNPRCDIHPKAQEVHGLSREFLADKPLFADVVKSLFDFTQGDEIIAHNAGFDVMFLRHEMKLLDIKFWDHFSGVIDTLPMARKLFPGKKNTLDILCDRYGINREGRGKHGALIDCQLLAQVYIKMLDKNAAVYPVAEIDDNRPGYDMSKHLIR